MNLLKDIVLIEKGRKYNLLENHQPGAIRVFQANDFRNESKPLYTLDEGGIFANEDDILLVWDGSVGQMGFGKKGYVGSTMVRLEVKNKTKYSPYFLYKFLQTKAEYLKRKATGATIMHINRRSLEQLEVPDIDFQDQLYIGNVLYKSESIISQRKESIILADELLHNTFLEIFYLNQEMNMWREVKFEELADKKKGGMRTGPFGSSLLHEEFTETGDVKVLGIDNVVKNKFEWKRSRCITFEKFQSLKRYQVFPGDVLISIMATLGKTAVVPEGIPLAINSKHLAAITLDKTIANPYFIAFAFHSHPLIVRQLSSNAKGSIMDGLNLSIIKKVKIKLPPIELQNEFGNLWKRVQNLKNQYQNSLLEFEALFASLSHKAFSGELSKDKTTSVREVKVNTVNVTPIERKTLAGWIIQMFNDNPKFGVTMFQKNLHICEYYSEVEYETNYLQNRAGPDDRQFMKAFLEEMVEKKWYRQEQKFKLIRFIPDENAGKLVKKYGEYFKDKARKISFVLKLLKDKNLDDVELISTLYAVWNNRIIRKEEITSEVLANDVFSWSEEKNKYTRAEIKLMYEWMNENRLIPVGFGKEIRRMV